MEQAQQELADWVDNLLPELDINDYDIEDDDDDDDDIWDDELNENNVNVGGGSTLKTNTADGDHDLQPSASKLAGRINLEPLHQTFKESAAPGALGSLKEQQRKDSSMVNTLNYFI